MIPFKKNSPNIGTIVDDFDIKNDLNSSNAQEIPEIFLKNEVIQFKNQNKMSSKKYLDKESLICAAMSHPLISSSEA